jgi:hypothetical protein
VFVYQLVVEARKQALTEGVLGFDGAVGLNHPLARMRMTQRGRRD